MYGTNSKLVSTYNFDVYGLTTNYEMGKHYKKRIRYSFVTSFVL